MKNNLPGSYWGAYRIGVQAIMLPDNGPKPKDISYWRNEIFCNLLTYLVPLSVIALVPSVYMAFRNGFPVVAITDLVALALVISIMTIRGMTLDQRKFIFVCIFYCLSVILLYYVSTSGAGMLFLLALTVLSAVIYSPRAAYYSALANTVICIVFGVMIHFGIHVSIYADNQVGTWIAVSSNLVLLSLICAVILNLILRGLGTTITERMIVEEDLQNAYERLQLSEANLSAVIENAGAHIYSIDRDLNYLTFNSLLKNAILQIYGMEIYPGDNVFGFLEKMAPSEAQEWKDRYAEAFAGKSLQFTKVFDIGDSKNYTSFSIHPIWEDDLVTGLSCFARDITPQKQAEAEVAALNESLEKKVEQRTAELQEVNKELETFSYTVSHDLQSPLRALSGFSQILLADYKDKLDEDGKQYLGIIDASAKRMSYLIRDLLHFSKLGREELTITEVNMNDVVGIVINEQRMAHPDYKAEIIVSPLSPLVCDQSLMRLVWANLIGNALKYSSKKEAPIVEIGMKNEDGRNVYYVKDNGAGFNMQFAHKLFAVFQRMHLTEEFEGTGVGLATVHRIISKHGGKIWAEGKENCGATFYFSIPELSVPEIR